MEKDLEQIEELFKKADFSGESDLKPKLGSRFASVRHTSLENLMKEEGVYPAPSQDKKKHVRVKNAVGKDREMEALEKYNPYKQKLPSSR